MLAASLHGEEGTGFGYLMRNLAQERLEIMKEIVGRSLADG